MNSIHIDKESNRLVRFHQTSLLLPPFLILVLKMPKSDPELTLLEISKSERINLAITTWLETKELPNVTIRSTTRHFGAEESTIRKRMIGTKSRQEYSITSQSLTSEEATLANWALQSEAWGGPPRVSNLQFMAASMIRERNPNFHELGKN